MAFILTKCNNLDHRTQSQIEEDNAITKFYFNDEINVYNYESKIKNIIKVSTECKNGLHAINFNGNLATVSDSDIKRILVANGFNIPAHFNNKHEYEELSKLMKKNQKSCIVS